MDQDKFANDIIRHTIASQSYDASEAAKITRMLNATIEDMKAELAVRYAKTQAKGVDRGPATTKRIEEMIAGLESLNREVYGKIGKTMEDGLVDRARHEMQFARDANKKAGGVNLGTTLPDANYLRTLVNHTPIPIDPDTSTLLKPWLRDMERDNLGRLNRVVQSALISGKTPAELGDLLEKGGFAKSRASAQALAITANSAVANAARLETFKKMRGITHVEWSSILDTRTTAGCQALSGKIFAIDDPALPPCPRHIRCRSTYLPRKNDTDPPLHKPYPEWLKGQPAKVQDEVLGKARGGMFRDGTITDADLYRDDGTFRTLDELKRADANIVAPEPSIIKPDTRDATDRALVLERGRKNGKEHLICYDEATGETVATKQGNKSSVTFPPELVAMLNDKANAIILHHNHPGSTSLSLPDVLVATKRPGAAGIWAHGHNGSSYFAKRGAKAFSEATYRAIAKQVRAALQGLITRRIITLEEAVLMDNHLVWLAVQAKGQLDYEYELDGDSLKAFNRNKAIYTLLLENLK